jgi:hypothetical protein
MGRVTRVRVVQVLGWDWLTHVDGFAYTSRTDNLKDEIATST